MGHGRSARGALIAALIASSALAVSFAESGDRPAGAADGEAEPGRPASPYAAWKNGPSPDPAFFPIAVWLQAPANAAKYRAIGINLFVGLWKGPTAAQLDELDRHGMRVICSQNAFALAHLERRTIAGWMHGDEPDNARSLGEGKGYGPPIEPAAIAADYRRIRDRDPSRPVLLNLGQGVAWDGWHGRGVRSNHPEDYAEYVKGCDIASFDIYPVNHDRPAVAGKLWYVPHGVARLRRWAGPARPVWSCIECTRIGELDRRPTPEQVKAEVWMALVHGAQGLIYFCHQFEPRFIEAGLLADERMAAAVGAINREIHDLAPVLNSATLAGAVRVAAEPPDVSPELSERLDGGAVAALAKRHGGALYIFAVRMEAGPARASFEVAGLPATAKVHVIGEDRAIAASRGRFTDDFAPHAVHLYRIP